MIIYSDKLPSDYRIKSESRLYGTAVTTTTYVQRKFFGLIWVRTLIPSVSSHMTTFSQDILERDVDELVDRADLYLKNKEALKNNGF